MDKQELKKKLIVFYKKINFIHVLVFVLIIIGTINYTLNTPKEFSIKSELTTETEVNKKLSILPEQSLALLPESIQSGETENFNYLFSKFDLTGIKKDKVFTLFREGIKKYLITYEIDGGLETYLSIKDAISNTIAKEERDKSSIVEANNLGVYSFYYNDFSKKNTVYLISLIGGRVWAFEYPRERHEEMKAFTKSITENL